MAHRYLFDTNVYDRWDSLPEKWRRYRDEVRRGRAEVVVFESLIAECARKLASKSGGEERARSLLGAVLSSHRVRDDTASPREALEAGIALNRIASKKGFQDASLSLVDYLVAWHAHRTDARVVTGDHGIQWCARELRADCDYLPLGI